MQNRCMQQRLLGDTSQLVAIFTQPYRVCA
ncbi:Uncharacterised protein [Vibrio cholerae]|nr:Uncharacterised protein [Vibrio cholerae]CSC19653.1 Uncharacterised protein [Vibrio cholerae]